MQLFANVAIKKCNGELFSPKKFRSNESKQSNTIINEIKNKDNR
jgi:hypothetical protein